MRELLVVPSVVVAGAVAQRGSHGGHAWVFLQYLLGLRRLGWDVSFVDHLDVVPNGGQMPTAVGEVAAVMSRFDLAHKWSVLLPGGASWGMSRQEVRRSIAQADVLLNVMGYLDDSELIGVAALPVFLDIDPGWPQMWRELGLADVLSGHGAYATVGANVGQPSCAIPTVGVQWAITRPPVVLEEWPASTVGSSRFTSVATWRGPFAPVEYEHHTYGLRVHEFRRFVELPSRTSPPYEIALNIHGDDDRDLALLRAHQWELVDPSEVAADPWSYREYVQGSGAEFLVAKNMYVDTNSGWFSDRSACYLASAKPVLAQDTGISDLYPTGNGLLIYSTLDEAVAGAEEIVGNYARHSEAAREIAEEFFDSDKVLSKLLDDLGVG